MFLEYNFDKMIATSKKMNDILNEGISEDSISQFVNCGLALNWKGAAAERFRTDLNKVSSLQEFSESQLRFIANYPKMCAKRMAKSQIAITSIILES